MEGEKLKFNESVSFLKGRNFELDRILSHYFKHNENGGVSPDSPDRLEEKQDYFKKFSAGTSELREDNEDNTLFLSKKIESGFDPTPVKYSQSTIAVPRTRTSVSSPFTPSEVRKCSFSLPERVPMRHVKPSTKPVVVGTPAPAKQKVFRVMDTPAVRAHLRTALTDTAEKVTTNSRQTQMFKNSLMSPVAHGSLLRGKQNDQAVDTRKMPFIMNQVELRKKQDRMIGMGEKQRPSSQLKHHLKQAECIENGGPLSLTGGKRKRKQSKGSRELQSIQMALLNQDPKRRKLINTE